MSELTKYNMKNIGRVIENFLLPNGALLQIGYSKDHLAKLGEEEDVSIFGFMTYITKPTKADLEGAVGMTEFFNLEGEKLRPGALEEGIIRTFRILVSQEALQQVISNESSKA